MPFDLIGALFTMWTKITRGQRAPTTTFGSLPFDLIGPLFYDVDKNHERPKSPYNQKFTCFSSTFLSMFKVLNEVILLLNLLQKPVLLALTLYYKLNQPHRANHKVPLYNPILAIIGEVKKPSLPRRFGNLLINPQQLFPQ